MSKRMKKIDEEVLENRIIVSLIIIAICIITVLGFIWISNSVNNNSGEEKELAKEEMSQEQEDLEVIENQKDNEQSEIASSSIGKTVEESEEKKEQENVITNENSSSITSDNNTVETSQSAEQTQTEKESKEQEKEEIQPVFIMPVEGDVIKGFSTENLVFSETLQEWVVHQALDIKANSRDVVKCSAEGTVKSIKNDPRYGLTVIVEHAAGFQTVYSNLLTAEFVVEGEEVKQGQTLGTVGSSAVFEIADESHLHFEMLLNSEPVDPSIYIK